MAIKYPSKLVVADTLVFKLNEYFIELNQAKFKYLNQFLIEFYGKKDYWIIFELNIPVEKNYIE